MAADASMDHENVITNWSINLSDAMRKDGTLLLFMHWYPAPKQNTSAGTESLIARRCDELCIAVTDSENPPTKEYV